MLQSGNQFLLVGNGLFKARGASADVTDNVGITATNAAVAQSLRHVDGYLILVITAPAVVNFNNFHIFGHAELLKMRGHANPLPSRVAWHSNGVVGLAGGDHVGQR